jgi:omega-6 fatty acid desaturase (delta-12 desaturase)
VSIERDENFVPRTRTDYNLPPESSAHLSDYHEIFEETPIYTLGRMLFMQVLGWQIYLTTNAMGSPMYPPWTNVRTSYIFYYPSFDADMIADRAAFPTIFSTL